MQKKEKKERNVAKKIATWKKTRKSLPALQVQ